MQTEATVAHPSTKPTGSRTDGPPTEAAVREHGESAAENGAIAEEWRDLAPGRWQRTINVRDFIQCNVTPYEGDEAFLAQPSERTKAVWAKLQPYFEEEQKKGVLDVDAATPSSVLAHAPGHIDRENEVIVGLQTDKPFKRAIFPAGGLRMVEAGLKAAGFEADAAVHQAFTKSPSGKDLNRLNRM
jgi:formate C-acetyltransferase